MPPKVLLIEDEPRIAQFIVEGLTEEGFDVGWARTGEEGITYAHNWPADIIILDIRLPDLSGIDVCRRLRQEYPETAILMLTALDAIKDRVHGLEAGADDYLPKPFAFEEFLARIHALLRRPGRLPTGRYLRDRDLVLDIIARTCHFKEHEVHLTNTEFDLLACFLRHRGEILSREELHREVWGLQFDRGTNLIDVYVSYLRRKLREIGFDPPIETIRKRGYRYRSS